MTRVNLGGGGGGTGGGGGRVSLALEMGKGVPPACSKPDPVPTRFAAKKTPCPNLENLHRI